MDANTTPAGLVVTPSQHDPAATAERLVAAVTARGMAVIARVDHAAAAAKVGMKLRPTEVMMFGNPQAGTPLMQAAQTAGIDLPLKVLIWQDEAGRTWLGYNDPHWIAARHGIAGLAPALDGMSHALAAIVQEAGGS